MAAKVPLKTGPNYGSAAATDLEFTVSSSSSGRSGIHISPLVWGIGGGIIGLVLIGVLVRRSGLRIRIDRSTPPAG